MKAALLVLLTGHLALASVPKKVPLLDPAFFPEPVALSVDEVLSMPAANRLPVAKLRKNQLVEPLKSIAFSEKADFQTRWSALVLVAQLLGPEAGPVLEKALQHKEWYLRNAALLTYPTVLPKKTVHVGLQMLEDKALVVRSAAIEVLETNLDSQVREALWTEIDQPRNFRKKQSLWIRPQILQILAKNPELREIPLFLNHLREKDSKLYPFAMQALEKLTNKNLNLPNLSLSDRREVWLKWGRQAKVEYAEYQLN